MISLNPDGFMPFQGSGYLINYTRLFYHLSFKRMPLMIKHPAINVRIHFISFFVAYSKDGRVKMTYIRIAMLISSERSSETRNRRLHSRIRPVIFCISYVANLASVIRVERHIKRCRHFPCGATCVKDNQVASCFR